MLESLTLSFEMFISSKISSILGRKSGKESGVCCRQEILVKYSFQNRCLFLVRYCHILVTNVIINYTVCVSIVSK